MKETQSCPNLCNQNGLYSPWNSPGQNIGVGSHSLLQGIFPTQGSNPGLPHCRRSLYQLKHQGSPRIRVSLSLGEGNGTPLQYSCLANPMDGGAWWAAVHGVAKSRTQLPFLSLFTFLHWRRKRQPTPVFLPGESQGRGSLVGCRLWDRMGSHRVKHTEAT